MPMLKCSHSRKYTGIFVPDIFLGIFIFTLLCPDVYIIVDPVISSTIVTSKLLITLNLILKLSKSRDSDSSVI